LAGFWEKVRGEEGHALGADAQEVINKVNTALHG